MFDGKTEKIAEIIVKHGIQPANNLLVVGCGTGLEAAILSKILGVPVTGTDLEDNFDQLTSHNVFLEVGDAENMKYEDASFCFVYSYHALEHMSNPAKALREMSRVLKPGGGFCIGTPNRSRIVGYLGSKDATAWQKLVWNLSDWKMRLLGRFRNELGAHAGYSTTELRAMLVTVFSEVHDVTGEYYRLIYGHHPKIMDLIYSLRLSSFVLPSIYFVGRR